MWQMLLKMALPMVIKAIEGRIGREALEAMQAGISYAATAALASGAERKIEAWTFFARQVDELKLAIGEEMRTGVPWVLNLLFEALVAKTKLMEAK